jgi:hypothetical protein
MRELQVTMMIRTSQSKALFVAMMVGLTLPLLFAAPPSPGLAGTYRLDRQASDDIDQAIEKAVSKTNFIVRTIARGRLHKTNPMIQQLIIAFPDTRVSVANDGHPAMVVPLGGTSVKWTRDDGETFDVRATLQNGTLTTTYVAEDGTRTNTYTPAADGKGMMMHVTVSSPHLPQPLQYQLAFVR